MSKKPLALICLALSATLLALVLFAGPSSAGSKAPSDYIKVADNNTENMPSGSNTPKACKGSWRSLPKYLGAHFVPDVMNLEQIDPKKRKGQKQSQLARYKAALAAKTGVAYKAIVSDRDPKHMNAPKPCQRYKGYQANAILYRADRFQQVGKKRVVQSLRSPKGKGCTKRNDQARSRVVYAQLRDLGSANRLVNVAAIHWPTATHDKGKRCASANGHRVRRNLAKLGAASLSVIAGDANVSPSRGGNWYSTMRKKAKFVDPVYRFCKGKAACLRANGSIGGAHGTAKRIDFIFAHGAGHKTKGRAIPFEAANPGSGGASHYSQHRAVRAKVFYP